MVEGKTMIGYILFASIVISMVYITAFTASVVYFYRKNREPQRWWSIAFSPCVGLLFLALAIPFCFRKYR